MLIQCPACKFQTNISDSKQGAKLRCPECSRVFVARPRGAARSSGSSDASRFVIPAIVAVAAIVLFLMFGRDKGDEVVAAPDPTPAAEKDDAREEPEGSGWDSAPVAFVRELHALARAGEESKLLLALDEQRAWAEMRADDGAWADQPRSAQTEFHSGLVQDLVHGEASELVATWEPFDGWVEDRDGDTRLVRVRVAHLEDTSLPNRHVEWRVVKHADKWKAYGWTRWISPEEQEALDRAARDAEKAARPKIVRKTLTDGSKVIEGEVRAIPYMDETPQEERDRIDGLLGRLVDLEAEDRSDWMAAQGELKEIGKPAIPPLLTFIAETPHTTIEAGSQLMRVNLTLMDITGYITSFKPHETLGATEERQESGLKQWFGWYDRKFKRFTEAEEAPDPFADEEE